MGVLALLFIAVPIAEIYVIIQVGQAIGGLETVGLIFVMAIAGAWLARMQGAAALRQVQQALGSGQAIGRSLIEGALVLVAAVLMITPGFITDAIGLLLLLPPVRSVVAARVAKWAEARTVATVGFGPGMPGMPDMEDMADMYGPADERDDQDPPPPGIIDV